MSTINVNGTETEQKCYSIKISSVIRIRVAASKRWQFSPIFLFSFTDAALRFRTFNFLLVLSLDFFFYFLLLDFVHSRSQCVHSREEGVSIYTIDVLCTQSILLLPGEKTVAKRERKWRKNLLLHSRRLGMETKN